MAWVHRQLVRGDKSLDGVLLGRGHWRVNVHWSSLLRRRGRRNREHVVVFMVLLLVLLLVTAFAAAQANQRQDQQDNQEDQHGREKERKVYAMQMLIRGLLRGSRSGRRARKGLWLMRSRGDGLAPLGGVGSVNLGRAAHDEARRDERHGRHELEGEMAVLLKHVRTHAHAHQETIAVVHLKTKQIGATRKQHVHCIRRTRKTHLEKRKSEAEKNKQQKKKNLELDHSRNTRAWQRARSGAHTIAERRRRRRRRRGGRGGGHGQEGHTGHTGDERTRRQHRATTLLLLAAVLVLVHLVVQLARKLLEPLQQRKNVSFFF